MPKVSDTWKPGFSTVAGIKAMATGNYADGVFNLVLALGQSGYAIGKHYIPKRDVGERFGPRRDGKESLNTAFGVEAIILERGIQMVTAMTLLLGSGKEQGQTFEAASNLIKLSWENLKDATVAGDSWSGASADAYNALNAAQMEWATIMQDLDLQVAAILQQNSETLGNCKITMTSVRAFYTMCIPIAATLRWAYGPAGVAISLQFQTAMFFVGLPIAMGALGMAIGNAVLHGQELAVITAGYTAAAASATLSGSESVEPEVAPAQKSRVSQFDQIDSATALATVPTGIDEGATSAPDSFAAAAGIGESANAPSDWQWAPSDVPTQTGSSPSYTASALGSLPSASSVSPTSSATRASSAAKTGPESAAEEDVAAWNLDGAATGSEAAERAPIAPVSDGNAQAREGVR